LNLNAQRTIEVSLPEKGDRKLLQVSRRRSPHPLLWGL
jgi:hypothetical protein